MNDLAVVISNDNKEVTPLETINAIKEAGFKKVFIQWYDKDRECSEKKQLDYARKQGLEVIFAHLGYQNINNLWEDNKEGEELVTRYKNDIKTCKENNINLVIMHLTSRNEAPPYNELGLNRLKEIVNYAKKLNVKIAFENNKIKNYTEYVLENIKDENVGFCFDTGHFHAFFQDEFDFNIVKNRIFAVHLHDNHGSTDEHLYPFDGTINWNNIIKILKECNYKGPITLELVRRNDYLKIPIKDFYKKGYKIGKEISKMLNGK